MDYEVGDMITYRAWGNTVRTGIVTAKYADIKNGGLGFEIVNSGSGCQFWGYDTQIIAVYKLGEV